MKTGKKLMTGAKRELLEGTRESRQAAFAQAAGLMYAEAVIQSTNVLYDAIVDLFEDDGEDLPEELVVPIGRDLILGQIAALRKTLRAAVDSYYRTFRDQN